QIAVRGNPHILGAKVARGFLSAIPLVNPPSIDPAQSGRKELAEWLVRKENPLPAQVMVNRIWHHLFGAGIVRTTDDFGRTGEPADGLCACLEVQSAGPVRCV